MLFGEAGANPARARRRNAQKKQQFNLNTAIQVQAIGIFSEKASCMCAKSKYPNNKMLSLNFASAKKESK